MVDPDFCRRRKLVHRLAVGAVILVLSLVTALALFEVLYRVQVIDTYAPELRTYNPPDQLNNTTGLPTALLMGDSFTAGAGESYPSQLRRVLPGARIINAAVPGTGIIQTAIMAGPRFARFRPRVFVYQIYVGNDLFDIRYPKGWGRASVLRNLYWFVSGRLRSVAFVNYRLSQTRFQRRLAGTERSDPTTIDQPFSPALYTTRARLYFEAEPGLVNESVLVRGQRARDFAVLVERLRPVLAKCTPGECTAYVLVIPHCAQVTPDYLRRFQVLGATLDSAAMQTTDYPFVAELRSKLRDLPNVTVLNPIIVLRKSEESGMPVYHSNDDHLNSTGNRVLEHFLAPQLATSLGLTLAPERQDPH